MSDSNRWWSVFFFLSLTVCGNSICVTMYALNPDCGVRHSRLLLTPTIAKKTGLKWPYDLKEGSENKFSSSPLCGFIFLSVLPLFFHRVDHLFEPTGRVFFIFRMSQHCILVNRWILTILIYILHICSLRPICERKIVLVNAFCKNNRMA